MGVSSLGRRSSGSCRKQPIESTCSCSIREIRALQTFTTIRSGRVACMETHTKATFFENGLPDEQTLRAALESAFTAIDRDDNAELDSEELARAGFDPELLLTC